MSALIYWNDELRENCSYNNLSKNVEKNIKYKEKIKHPGLLYENHVQNSILALDKSGYCLKILFTKSKIIFQNIFFIG